MPEILSQAEIDELLNALKTGGEAEPATGESAEERHARTYDFRTANRFTKEQMRSLGIVFETYAQLFANRITNILRVSCECEVLSTEELRYNEFNNSLPMPVILGVFQAPPMEGSQLLQVSPEVAYMLINRLLGGAAPSKESGKSFTEIELALIERLLHKVMHTYDEAWEKVLSVRSHLERLETNTQFIQVTGLNDAVAVGTLSLKVGEDEGFLSLCLPRGSLEPILGLLNTRTLYSAGTPGRDRERDESQTQRLSERLSHTKVTLTTYFNETAATVMDIVNLQVGDVIRLNHLVSEPLTTRVEHMAKFHGKMGTSGSRYAMKLTGLIEEGEDESFAG